jgi:hypothetical protein
MNPWLLEQLMQTRVAELRREVEYESAGRGEPLLAAQADFEVAASSRLRRSVGRALVRAGSRVGGFDVPRTAHLAELRRAGPRDSIRTQRLGVSADAELVSFGVEHDGPACTVAFPTFDPRCTKTHQTIDF